MAKRITSLFLALIMLITCSVGATISYAANNLSAVDKKEEIVIINGKEYKYEDEFVNGKNVTRIINLTDDTEDILYYAAEKGTVLLNDIPVAYIEAASIETLEVFENNILPLASNGWRYHDTSSHYITWVQGVSAAVLAGVIAYVIPVKKSAIIAGMGVTALGIVAAACAGGTVTCKTYTQVLLDGKVQLRYDWKFTPNTGETYGPYSSYQL